jgi:hypothetical protein
MGSVVSVESRGLTYERLALILVYCWPHRTIEQATA